MTVYGGVCVKCHVAVALPGEVCNWSVGVLEYWSDRVL
jgi:hypothetical protein